MSIKSERKKAIKAQKQREAASTQSLALSSPRKWYAEDAAEYVEEHRKHCTDPKCNNNQAISMSMRGEKMVAMVFAQKLNEIFFALYSTDTDADYRPFMSLQLANPDDLRALFNSDGSLLPCQWSECEHEHKHNKFMCLAFMCHNEGAAISFEPNGAAAIRCKACGNWMRFEGVPDEFRLAPRPKAEWPNIFCSHHGIEPRYIGCRHVLEEGKYPAWLFASDAENPGEALCEDCGKMREAGSFYTKENRDLWHSVCQSGLDAYFHGLLKGMLEAVGQSFYVLPSTVLDTPAASTSVN